MYSFQNFTMCYHGHHKDEGMRGRAISAEESTEKGENISKRYRNYPNRTVNYCNGHDWKTIKIKDYICSE